jgi:hypothetical protein
MKLAICFLAFGVALASPQNFYFFRHVSPFNMDTSSIYRNILVNLLTNS